MDRKPSFTWWDGLGRCVIYMDDMSYDYNIPLFE